VEEVRRIILVGDEGGMLRAHRLGKNSKMEHGGVKHRTELWI
jgi:hypothetical protein